MVNSEIYIKIKSLLFNPFLRFFYCELGKNVKIISPLKIQGVGNIKLGDQVRIGYKTRLSSLPYTNEKSVLLSIGDGSCLGNFNHIICSKKIHIGKKVLTSDRVYISDNLHNYENINLPIMEQSIRQLGEVYIGDGSWIGENACILGVKIGKNCIVGANSVVTKDIPDFSVAVGIPAKVIKSYNFKTKTWDKIA